MDLDEVAHFDVSSSIHDTRCVDSFFKVHYILGTVYERRSSSLSFHSCPCAPGLTESLTFVWQYWSCCLGRRSYKH